MASVSVNFDRHVIKNWEFPSVLPKFPTASDVRAVAQQSFKKFENAWNYLGKSIVVTRHSLNATLKSPVFIDNGDLKTAARMSKAVTRLKLFSILSVPSGLLSMPSQIQKIWNGIQWNDSEGTVLSFVAFAYNATDIFETTTSFVNAVLQNLSKAPIGWISAIGTPLILTILGFGSISRGAKITHLFKFLTELDRDLIAKVKDKSLSPDQLREVMVEYLNSHLGTMHSEEVLKDAALDQTIRLKQSILERHSNSKTVELLKTLQGDIQNADQDKPMNPENVALVLEKVALSVKKEIAVQSGFLLTNIINAVASVMLLIPGAQMVSFILLAISMFMRLLLQAYQDYQQWQFNKELGMTSSS